MHRIGFAAASVVLIGAVAMQIYGAMKLNAQGASCTGKTPKAALYTAIAFGILASLLGFISAISSKLANSTWCPMLCIILSMSNAFAGMASFGASTGDCTAPQLAAAKTLIVSGSIAAMIAGFVFMLSYVSYLIHRRDGVIPPEDPGMNVPPQSNAPANAPPQAAPSKVAPPQSGSSKVAPPQATAAPSKEEEEMSDADWQRQWCVTHADDASCRK